MSSNKTAKSKGRIAQVLADARASLDQPSRPFTPMSLDKRSTLDDNFSFSSTASLKDELKSYHKYNLSGSYASGNKQRDYGEKAAQVKPTRTERKKSQQHQSEIVHATEVVNLELQNLKLLLADMTDILALLEAEISTTQSGAESERTADLLDTLLPHVNKLSRLVKLDAPMMETGVR